MRKPLKSHDMCSLAEGDGINGQLNRAPVTLRISRSAWGEAGGKNRGRNRALVSPPLDYRSVPCAGFFSGCEVVLENGGLG